MSEAAKMEKLDLSTWPRREAFAFFSRLSNPYYMVSFRQDVSGVYDFAKANGLSFYYAMIWACTRAMNETEAFRLTVRGGELYRLDGRSPSFTDLKKGAEQFHIVTMPCDGDIRRFCALAARRSREQTAFLDESAETDELIYFSCLPWLDLTALTNERDLSAPGAADDCIPRVAWGRYQEENGRKKLTISLEVNHRLIDGLHLGEFTQNLNHIIDELK